MQKSSGGLDLLEKPTFFGRVGPAPLASRRRAHGQLVAQRPPSQTPVQHSSARAHASPAVLHARGVQIPGAPLHAPEQHSAVELQDAPSAAQVAWHTVTPRASGAHVPLQQSAPVRHTVPGARQGPPPYAQRLSLLHAPPQHGRAEPVLQSSPVGRHVASSSRWHFPPEHVPAQQSRVSAHASPSFPQSAPPQMPPWQASPQQSCARVHVSPSRRQYPRQVAAPPRLASQEPEQQSPRDVHGSPALAQEPFGRQVAPRHLPVQQSASTAHASATTRQAVRFAEHVEPSTFARASPVGPPSEGRSALGAPGTSSISSRLHATIHATARPRTRRSTVLRALTRAPRRWPTWPTPEAAEARAPESLRPCSAVGASSTRRRPRLPT